MLVVFNQQLAGDQKMKLHSTSFPGLSNIHGHDSLVNHEHKSRNKTTAE
jgi:hypothetical protein